MQLTDAPKFLIVCSSERTGDGAITAAAADPETLGATPRFTSYVGQASLRVLCVNLFNFNFWDARRALIKAEIDQARPDVRVYAVWSGRGMLCCADIHLCVTGHAIGASASARGRSSAFKK